MSSPLRRPAPRPRPAWSGVKVDATGPLGRCGMACGRTIRPRRPYVDRVRTDRVPRRCEDGVSDEYRSGLRAAVVGLGARLQRASGRHVLELRRRQSGQGRIFELGRSDRDSAQLLPVRYLGIGGRHQGHHPVIEAVVLADIGRLADSFPAVDYFERGRRSSSPSTASKARSATSGISSVSRSTWTRTCQWCSATDVGAHWARTS